MSAKAVKNGITCVTCALVFAHSDLQKEHYMSEWHRYNAKRLIAGYPAISEVLFEQKVKERQKASEDQKKKSETEKSYCKACKKCFQTRNAYDNHLHSKRHRTNSENFVEEEKPKVNPSTQVEDTDKVNITHAEKFVDGVDYDSESSDEQELSNWRGDDDEYDTNDAITETECIFCPQTSTSLEENLEHMAATHGFFIPDAQYCVDVLGLVKYIGLKVGAGRYCIKCNAKRFSDLHACRLHMKDKAHFTISLEGDSLMEYLDFYDYGDLLKDEDEEDDDVAVDLGYTLVLPSGAKVGHRSLNRYFKQRLRSDEDQERVVQARLALKSKVEQKALGWVGVAGPAAVQRARDFKFMHRVSQREMMRRGIRFNKLFKSRGRDDQM